MSRIAFEARYYVGPRSPQAGILLLLNKHDRRRRTALTASDAHLRLLSTPRPHLYCTALCNGAARDLRLPADPMQHRTIVSIQHLGDRKGAEPEKDGRAAC